MIGCGRDHTGARRRRSDDDRDADAEHVDRGKESGGDDVRGKPLGYPGGFLLVLPVT